MPIVEPHDTPQGDGSCVFTIVSRNYFHFALNLMASVAVHLPGCRRVVVVCDELDGLDPTPGVELLGIEALQIEALDRMVVHYTILELNTAIKPFAFEQLLRRDGVRRVVYFDPDIELFSSGAPLLALLDRADVVLTPHITAPLDDDRHPSDLSILQSGTYNLGFLALRRSDDSRRLLRWWQGKLVSNCVVDIPRGLFTDQKWMDLVPGLCANVHVERDVGWNVAYWNLAHRAVAHGTGGYTVNDRPLFFFHFSGYDPRSGSISKHQDRFRLVDCSAATQSLFAEYARRLDAAGRDRFSSLPYAFAQLADGTPLPDCARQVIRLYLDWSAPVPDLRSGAGARYLIEFLTAATDELRPPISRLALHLYRSREDLCSAFPDVLGGHRQAFADWFSERAGPEAGILGPLAMATGMKTTESPSTTAVRIADAVTPPPPAADTAPAAPPPEPARSAWSYRLMYRMAWRARHVLRPLTSLEFRQRARAALIKRAFPASAPAQSLAPRASEQPAAGVTVIGYVKAESGVGESARATLRALACTGVPHALQDYRVGNVSRMGESVDERLASGRRFAVSLFHVNADQMPVVRTFLGDEPFNVAHRIGFWAWELENFPIEWRGSFAHVDEVWVPSSFCQRAIAAAASIPVLVMPHAIDVPQYGAPDRARFGLRPHSVAFLAMADMMSVAERKNPFAAVEAFALAFRGRNDDVELVVKIGNGERDPAALQRLRSLVATCPGINLLPESLDRSALNSLIDSVDCFVSLHRSEGFGLVIAEAMARGKVAVATGWSGNMDFMTTQNSLPVDFDLLPIEADVGPYRRGERWAHPSLADAAAKLRQVAGDAALRQRLGQRARLDCQRLLSPTVVGAAMEARLRAIFAAKGVGAG